MCCMDIEDRIAGLERDNRRLRLGLLGLAAAAAAVLLIGAAPGGPAKSAPETTVHAAPAGPQRLVALGLRIVDADGKVRAELSGENGLVLFDHEGRPSAVLEAKPTGPALRLLDPKGAQRAVLETMGEGARLGLADRKGNVLAMLRAGADGTNLSVADADGRPRIRLGVLQEEAGLIVRGPKEEGIDLTVLGRSPLLRLRDGRGEPRLCLLGGEDGPAVRLLDGKGAVRASLGRLPLTAVENGKKGGRAETSEGSLVLTDERGMVAVELPLRAN